MDTLLKFSSSARHLILASFSLALACSAQAEDKAKEDEIATDRPDYVESSDVVGKGRWQIETSFAVEKNQANGSKDRTYSTPTLFRYGVTENLELRLETDGRLSARSEDTATGISQTQTGFADTSLGIKWHAMDAAGSMPSVGVLFHLDLASGSTAFRGNGVRPSVRVVGEWEFDNEVSLGVMPGVMLDKNADGGRFVSASFGLVIGKGWSEQFRTFVELAVPQITSNKNGGTVATLDIGAAYLLSKTMQIDTAISRGLNKRTPDWSWTVGLSVKF